MAALNFSRPQNLQLLVDSPDSFDIREFKVTDGLNMLFSVDLVVRCSNPSVDFEETIGRAATFRIETNQAVYPEMASPSWSGIVADIEQAASEDTGLSTYRIRLAPSFWLLTQRTNCRVFQQMTDLEIVTTLFTEWGLPFENACSGSYKTRKYRVQYQETDYAFVCRLLEASGISYLFEQRADVTTVVLRDEPEVVAPRALPLDHVNEPTTGRIFATGLKATRRMRSGRSTFADHDPRLPNEPLLGQASSSQHPLESRLEAFTYTPGAFKFGNAGPNDTPTADDRGRTRTDSGEAKLIAERDAAARIAASQHLAFKSNCLELRAGFVLSLANHPTAERFKKLLLTQVTISGTHNTDVVVAADAVSGELPFKPAQRTPKPNISGVECATVVGPAGETIHCDEFGRVRVQFHWDRYGKMNEYSSCWIPTNQPWAGEGFGMVNLPRIGQEVLVSFLGGNPEEPVVVGRVFTNLRRPPFALPEAKNESGFRSKSVPETGGYNLLRFVDTAGDELVEGRAEKDMRTRVNNDKALSVGRDRQMQIARDDDELVGGNQRETVAKDKLSRVFDSMLSIVGKDRLLKTVGNMISQAKAHAIGAEEVINLTVGNSIIYMDKDKIVIKAKTVLVNPDVSPNAESK
ncbi:MAG: type VI secretion system tip protein VgrG [Polyangiaceae bacterium]|nr:type VI secretion system tip protein VgrG [Polyangiaceae bacterium]